MCTKLTSPWGRSTRRRKLKGRTYIKQFVRVIIACVGHHPKFFLFYRSYSCESWRVFYSGFNGADGDVCIGLDSIGLEWIYRIVPGLRSGRRRRWPKSPSPRACCLVVASVASVVSCSCFPAPSPADSSLPPADASSLAGCSAEESGDECSSSVGDSVK